MIPFTPTHQIVAGGADASPAAGVADGTRRLDPKLPVQVIEHSATGWSHIRCENAWEAWIDPAKLEPLGTRAATSRTTVWLVCTGILVAVLIVGAVAFAVRNRGSDATEASPVTVAPAAVPTAGTKIGSATAYLTVPPGWVASADGLTVAQNAADLTAADPKGPRVLITTSAPNQTDLVSSFKNAKGAAPVDVGLDAANTKVSGRQAVVIGTVHETPSGKIIRTYLVVALGDGQSVIFEADAPYTQWDALKQQLGTIPGLR